MYIPIILGTAREGRQSAKAAHYMLKQIQSMNIDALEIELIDIASFLSQFTWQHKKDPAIQELGQKLAKAAGYIIVSPEYNHGYPGELKMFLDNFYDHYAKKPIGFCGVSIGGLGGARCIEQLRLVSIELHLVPIREAIYFSDIQNLFNEDGSIKDNSYPNRISKFLDELLWYAKALKKAREEDK